MRRSRPRDAGDRKSLTGLDRESALICNCGRIDYRDAVLIDDPRQPNSS